MDVADYDDDEYERLRVHFRESNVIVSVEKLELSSYWVCENDLV